MLIVGAIPGAAIGARLPWWLEDPITAFTQFPDAVALMQGKSILGGLLGGVVGVEIAKWRMRVLDSTGDAFVWPIIVGLSIGRHLPGLDDHTTGLPTQLPWVWDFGDGVVTLRISACVGLLTLQRQRLGLQPTLDPRDSDRRSGAHDYGGANAEESGSIDSPARHSAAPAS
jgi:hypothetical protein